ncbi:hypothetical protein HGI79_05480 [Clostridium sp. DJ247]|nr:hypothetical protein [Clostridium sp. DJ247]
MKKALFNPLRKLAVGTVSSVLTITDKTIKTAGGFKEGVEDIIAEAQYQRTKKRMTVMNDL